MELPPFGEIGGVQLGLIPPEIIRSESACTVTDPVLHTRGIPRPNGVIDPHLGASNRFTVCATCKNTHEFCPTHQGNIDVPYPVPHIAFESNRSLPRWLSIVCFNCSAPQVDPDNYAKYGPIKERLKHAANDTKKARDRKTDPLVCSRCGVLQPYISFEYGFATVAWNSPNMHAHFGVDPEHGDLLDLDDETEEERALRAEKHRYFVERPFSNQDVVSVLTAIDDEFVAAMGGDPTASHPRCMMITQFVVPAMAIRPTISIEENSKKKGYDEITRKLTEIVKSVRAVEASAEEAGVDLEEEDRYEPLPPEVTRNIEIMYRDISDIMIKDKAKISIQRYSLYQQRARANQKSIVDRWKRKEGRFRGGLSGKRVNHSGRTVVAPGANLDVDEIGMPRAMARKLTIGERINRINLTRVMRLIREGKVHEIRNAAKTTRIQVDADNRESIEVHVGWVVRRELQDGDYVIVNRQPTLHRQSMLAHRVKLIDELTLRLPLEATTPYNADFDGDEMNIHVPQTLEAMAEIRELMALQFHMVHTRANRPVIAMVQDSNDAATYLTSPDTLLTRHQVCQLMATVRYDPNAPADADTLDPRSKLGSVTLPPPAIVRPVEMWSGRQVMSMLLPRELSMRMRLKHLNLPVDDPDGWLEIRRGHIVSGTLCSRSLGTTSNGIIHHLIMYIGSNAAVRFVSDAQRLLNQFLQWHGLSMGISECIMPENSQVHANEIFEKAVRHMEAVEAAAGDMIDIPVVAQAIEGIAAQSMSKVLTTVGEIARSSCAPSNRLAVMSDRAKSKGSVFNIGQIRGAVGQQYVTGNRPGAKSVGRLLTCENFDPRGDPMRQRLVDRGMVRSPFIKGLTPQECLLSAMGGREGLVDTAVKTAETGYMTRRLVKALESLLNTYYNTVVDSLNNLVQEWFGYDGMGSQSILAVHDDLVDLDDAQVRGLVGPGRAAKAGKLELANLMAVRDEIREARAIPFERSIRPIYYLPANVAELINMLPTCPDCACSATAKTANQIRETVDACCDQLEETAPSLFLRGHVRHQLSTGTVRRCPGCVQKTCDRLVDKHRQGLLPPCEAIGALTATSLGEVTTQMTLNVRPPFPPVYLCLFLFPSLTTILSPFPCRHFTLPVA